MSAGKIVKGIVKRLLNNSTNHHHHHKTISKNRDKKDSFFLCEHFTDDDDDDNEDDDDDDDDQSESCWRRHRWSKKPPKNHKSLALPDIVPRETHAHKNHCHHCYRLYQPHHHYRHHGDREGDGRREGGWPPAPICVCEDCYLAIMNICQDRCGFCSVSPRRRMEGEKMKKGDFLQRPITEHQMNTKNITRVNKFIDLPPSIPISKDGEQPYRVCLKSLFPPGIMGPTVAPPNRTICHVTTPS